MGYDVWDTKEINICLFGDSGFIKLVVNGNDFDLYIENTDNDGFVEEVDLEAAYRLRDFLNYALPDTKNEKCNYDGSNGGSG